MHLNNTIERETITITRCVQLFDLNYKVSFMNFLFLKKQIAN